MSFFAINVQERQEGCIQILLQLLWLFSFLLGAEWDYSIKLSVKSNLPHAQILKLTKLNKLTACWWMKLLTTEFPLAFTVFSIDEPSLNNSFAFSIQGHSELELTVNGTD